MPFAQVYRDYHLNCTPYDTTDGLFVARVLMSKSDGEGQVETLLTPKLPPFSSAREAADAAQQAAISWIEKHG